MSQINPAYILAHPTLFDVHFNIIYTSTPSCSSSLFPPHPV
jgi:hypothetical protein